MKLKQCPFCGRDGKLTKGGSFDYPSWVAHCPGGSLKKSEGGCMIRPATAARYTEQEAISDWNTRTTNHPTP